METLETSRRTGDATVAVGLVLLVVAVFGQAVGFEFLNFDDDVWVLENPNVRPGLTARGIAWAFQVHPPYQYYPLTWLSHMLDFELFGDSPAGPHAVNVALHAAATALLYLFLAGATGLRGPSALAAALFGAHPLRAESVTWVAERKDVLSVFLAVGTLLAYAWYTRRPGPLRALSVAVVFTLGLLSKPMLVTLPAALLLVDLWPLGRLPVGKTASGFWREAGRLVLEKLPLGVPALAAAWLTIAAQGDKGALSALGHLSWGERIATAVTASAWYPARTLWPANPSIFHPWSPPLPAEVLASALALLLITVVAAVLVRRYPFVLAGWLFYLVTLLPVSQLLPIGAHRLAERYSYLPSIGLAAVIAFGAHAALAPVPGWFRTGLGAGVAGLFALLGFLHAGVFRDPVTLFSAALEADQGNWLAHNNLGSALAVRGEPEAALGHFRAALALRPGWEGAAYNLAQTLERLGRRDEAVAAIDEAVAANPRSRLLREIGAGVLRRAGQPERARELLRGLPRSPSPSGAAP